MGAPARAEQMAKVVLLRQRFASMEQLRVHLVAADGTTLVFFPDPTLHLAPGAEALFEVAFDNSEDTRVTRAVALSRAAGQGLWLALRSPRFARENEDGGLAPRKGRRLGADRVVRLRRRSHAEHLVVLADLSIAGARISGGLPEALARDDLVEMRLASPQPGEPADAIAARVVWREGSDAGLEIDRTDRIGRAAVTRLFQSLEQRWRSAREIRHLDQCCRSGRRLDPAAPRVRFDKKLGPVLDDG